MKKLVVACAAATAVLAVGTTASADSFGETGQIAISSDLQLDFSYVSPHEGDSYVKLGINPALDYFVSDNLSLGGHVGISHVSREGAKATAFTVGPRFGYLLELSDGVHMWPKIGADFTYGKATLSVAGISADASFTQLSIGLFAPITFSPTDNFFIGVGPNFSYEVMKKFEDADSQAGDLVIGLMSTVGGYF